MTLLCATNVILSQGNQVSSGKVSQYPRYLEPMAKPSARSNLRVASVQVETQEAMHEDQSNRLLQASASVTLVNNCGYDAYLGVYYKSFSWTYGRGFYYVAGNGGSFTIQHQVSDPTIHVFGLDSETFEGGLDLGIFQVLLFSGECFSEVNLGSLAGDTVQYNLCGNNPVPSPTAPPTPIVSPPTGTSSAVQDQWVSGHNLRRTDFFVTRNGMPDAPPIKWSNTVADSATAYANTLASLDGCQIQHGYQGDDYGGENLGKQLTFDFASCCDLC